MRVLWLVLSLLVFSAQAADGRAEKIAKLMEAQGLAETFDQQIKAGRDAAQRMADDLFSKLLADFHLTPAVETKLRAASVDFVKEAQPEWSGKQLAKVWAQYYGPHFSDDELDQLLAYYTSPLAQKQVQAGRLAQAQFNAHFEQQYKPIMETATQNYIKRIHAITAECKCKRRK